MSDLKTLGLQEHTATHCPLIPYFQQHFRSETKERRNVSADVDEMPMRRELRAFHRPSIRQAIMHRLSLSGGLCPPKERRNVSADVDGMPMR